MSKLQDLPKKDDRELISRSLGFSMEDKSAVGALALTYLCYKLFMKNKMACA